MTVEIRELVIQARVSSPGGDSEPAPMRGVAQEKASEARWVELIARRVLELLREEGSRHP